jgi:hypothetical protein
MGIGHFQAIGLNEHGQFRIVVPHVQVLQTGICVIALADEAFGLNRLGLVADPVNRFPK